MSEIEYARLICKSGSGLPTIPPSSDHDNGDWIPSDIYEAELYMDIDTGLLYTNSGGVIVLVNPSPPAGLEVGFTPIISGISGAILFEDSTGVVQEDSHLIWDNATRNLGVGEAPDANTRLDVRAQGAMSTDIAFRVRNSADSANILAIAGNGDVTIPTGKIGQGISPGTELYTSYTGTAGVSNVLLYNYSTGHGVDVLNRNGGVGFNGVVDSGVATVASFTNSSSSGGDNYALKLNATSGANNYALAIIAGDLSLPNSGAGTKIGGAGSIFSFWGATPVVQPTTGGSSATLVGGVGVPLTDTDTFDGYTLKQIVKALRSIGILA